MKKINVLVIMGGKSPEHEISLISGREVVKNLDEKKYNVYPICITRDGREWRQIDTPQLLSLPDPLSLKGTNNELVKNNYQEITPSNLKKIDVVFIAMHGPFGEDGTVQGMLELLGFKYTGSRVLASSIGMDKIMFRKLLKSENIKFPKFTTYKKGDDVSVLVKSLGKPPFFVKPYNLGSSVGMSIVKKKSDLENALTKALEQSEIAIVDEYIKGIEITCAILGNENPQALPLIEIIPKGEFFDYESKYLKGGANEIVPARISKELARKIQSIALQVYKLVNCRGFGRVDFIVDNKSRLFVLEINTIPGLTPMSLFPKAARAAGISYKELLSKVVQYALE